MRSLDWNADSFFEHGFDGLECRYFWTLSNLCSPRETSIEKYKWGKRKPRAAMKENLTVTFKTKNPLTPSEVKRAAVGLGIDQLGLEGDGWIKDCRAIGGELDFGVPERVGVGKEGQENGEGQRHRTKALRRHFRRRLVRKVVTFSSTFRTTEIFFFFVATSSSSSTLVSRRSKLESFSFSAKTGWQQK